MIDVQFENIYGAPPPELVGAPTGAGQFSPLLPGAQALEQAVPGSLNGLVLLAPPGTAERRYAIAQALRALRPDARLIVLAPKDKGGSRIGSDLRDLGCAFDETARRHHRICIAAGPGDERAIAAAIEEGKPRWLEEIGLWSQPGVFSWNRIDPGSTLLLANLPTLSGRGADFGCGLGVLAKAVLKSPKVVHLKLIDIDRRAVEMARRNVEDARAEFLWSDARSTLLTALDFVVMNPPFHDGGIEHQALGQSFIQRAAAALRSSGTCWLTANRHLPYEAMLKSQFRRVALVAEAHGYKIYQAKK
jgi:16S rRNA (guanine1207-N2)-methyltransferase